MIKPAPIANDPGKPWPVEDAAERLWWIRKLWRAGALDPLAADTALRPFRAHPNPRIAWLASETTRAVLDAFEARRKAGGAA